MNHKRYESNGVLKFDQGFTLLEISLSLAILGVVAIYTLHMYESVSARKKMVDDHSRMEKIVTTLKNYYAGHESLPPAGTSFTNSIPIADLGLGQKFRFDTFGRPYLYFPSPTASGITVDSRPAAGVIISLGENQTQQYTVTGTVYTTQGDDILVPIEVNTQAVAIALTELETLGKGVASYNRTHAGVQDNAGVNFYGDVANGAPPIIDPDYYDQYYSNVVPAPTGTYPQLYPFISSAYPSAATGNTNYFQPGPDWPTAFPVGPPPTYDQLVRHEPANWPGGGAYDGVILNTWPNDLTPTSAAAWIWPDQGANDPAATGTRPLPPNYTITDPAFGFFGVYPYPPHYPGTNVPALPAYELIDEGGCRLVAGVAPADPSCGYVDLDTQADPVGFIRTRYGFGPSLLTDPWGNRYQWGGSVPPADPRYHIFYSMGPDGTPGTSDDIFLF